MNDNERNEAALSELKELNALGKKLDRLLSDVEAGFDKMGQSIDEMGQSIDTKPTVSDWERIVSEAFSELPSEDDFERVCKRVASETNRKLAMWILGPVVVALGVVSLLVTLRVLP